jgi:competence protein ComEA
MRQAIFATLFITVLCWFWLFPRSEPVNYVDVGPVHLKSFEVKLSGEVVFPGIYTFYEDTSLEQIIKYAGGLLPNADKEIIQFALKIDRNRDIVIPSKVINTPISVLKVNINKASFKELIEIPYMTETRAASLVVYREAHGYFQSIDDLINVKHIGAVTLENIKPYITLG